jgi:sulfur carrier protein
MKIKINGEESSIDSGLNITEFIKHQLNGKEPGGVAVAVNSSIVPKSKWNDTVINENDEIEIVTAVQGG